jgi:hypothetical protein
MRRLPAFLAGVRCDCYLLNGGGIQTVIGFETSALQKGPNKTVADLMNSLRKYYHGHFRTDLRAFMPRSDVPYFGHSWHSDCRELSRVPTERRAQFLVCLYFSVLVDQSVHAHFRHLYERFESLTRSPKFCHGLGQFQKNPRDILDEPFEKGFVSGPALSNIIPAGMDLFIDEVIHFASTQMPELKPPDLFHAIIADSDVQIPLLVVLVNPRLKEYPAWQVYDYLQSAVAARFPNQTDLKKEAPPAE